MSDLQHIHNAIIDNPDFNLTVAAKRDLRELTAEVERLTTENERLRGACISVTYVEEYPMFRQGYPTHEMEELLNADVCTIIVRMIAILRVKLQESENE